MLLYTKKQQARSHWAQLHEIDEALGLWNREAIFRAVKAQPKKKQQQASNQQGCYGSGTDVNDSRSERIGPHVTKLGFADSPTFYKVREGDTLTSIALKFKVSVQSIAILNDIADVDYVPAGKLLIIHHEHMKTGEVVGNANHSSSSVETQACEGKSIVQTESSLSLMPAFASSFCLQSWHVRLALSLVLLLAISSLVRRYVNGLRTRRDELLQSQVQTEIQEVHHQPKLRRWQGILDDDRRVNEVEGDLLADSRTTDVEEENLRQTYAQLESAYAKFLADSGLTKSGYWRGGVPPALEEK
ncbi:hypothetical protein GOP47_0000550 [Adiantum capillus-veneris]|uniref:LysM domain-containing protein n=1 Tax=Adiantum capillus-veneris TaxID=13818 RepID=A0A9D4VEY5_ADICA|nr:hypothetical protein GOP47_0000550 [Adiantum capillus-veneris]